MLCAYQKLLARSADLLRGAFPQPALASSRPSSPVALPIALRSTRTGFGVFSTRGD